MDRTVLITGCSSGIGRATARFFRDEEWTVYATARDVDDVADLADLGCRTQPLDVTDRAHCERAVDRVIDEEGRLDVLVNNAGYGQLGTVEDLPTSRVEDQFDVNVYGPHRLVRAALPHMREAGDGTVVNVSSGAALVTGPGLGVYSASKAALETMSDALRAEVDAFGVDVVLVEPGPVTTEFQERALDELNEVEAEGSGAYRDVYEFHRDRYSLGDVGRSTPGEVADTVVEAATDLHPEERYTVGSVARAAALARHLPASWRDAAFSLARRVIR
jgi:NAD(P)-dependent dehydrogenase (short-subunit alcohol dehydrogenase family)